MKATELLEEQHHDINRLFKAIGIAKDKQPQQALFLELAAILVAHDAIERQLFYPACQEIMGLSPDLGEALVEHGVIEFCLYQAHEALGKADFDFKCKVLKEVVEHHVEEEEDEFFPQALKALGNDALDALGDEMQEAFEDALGEDFRQPLYENLRQVFAGALEPLPLKSESKAKTA